MSAGPDGPVPAQAAAGAREGVVDLGGYEVDLSVLRHRGHSRAEIRRTLGFFYEVTLNDTWRIFPANGWRLIAQNLAESVFAIPETTERSTWTVVRFEVRRGVYCLAGWQTSIRPRIKEPGEQQWLRLAWPGTQSFVAGTAPVLHVDLQNTGLERSTVPSPAELLVVGWLVELPSERTLPAARQVCVAPARTRESARFEIQPRRSLRLRVELATLEPERLPAGRYGLRSYLSKLQLSSPLGQVVVTERR